MEGLEKLILDPTEPDDDDVRRNDSGDDGSPRHIVESGGPEAPAVPPPRLRRKGNTGIKGVLADAAEARERAKQRREDENRRNWQLVEKHSMTVAPQNVSNSNDLEDEFRLEEDDPVLREFRQQRLGEILLKQKQPSLPKPPTFGFLANISRREYVTAIDKEHPAVFIIVHLYQSYIPACVRLNNYLGRLAIRHPRVKFLSIVATEAKEDFLDEGLPALLIYREKELYASFVPLTEKLPEDFEADDVELLLTRYKIVEAPVKPKAAAKSNGKGKGKGNDESSDDEERDLSDHSD